MLMRTVEMAMIVTGTVMKMARISMTAEKREKLVSKRLEPMSGMLMTPPDKIFHQQVAIAGFTSDRNLIANLPESCVLNFVRLLNLVIIIINLNDLIVLFAF